MPTTITGTTITTTALTGSTISLTGGTQGLVTPTEGSAPYYGVRAWVNINGKSSGSFAGGVSTVSRASGSTTATVTTTNPHGLITGNYVDVVSGVAAGVYTVTLVNSTTFTITTVATTLLSNAAITFAVNTIRAGGNVSSVGDGGAGVYHVNFSTAMPDVNYVITATTQWVAASGGGTGNPYIATESGVATGTAGTRTTAACTIIVGSTAGSNTDTDYVNVVIVR